MPRPSRTDSMYHRLMPSMKPIPFTPCNACDRAALLRQPGVVSVGDRLYRQRPSGPATLLVEYALDPHTHGRDCDAPKSHARNDHHPARLEERRAAASQG